MLQFGEIQDVYMPKDASRQARRGIGFVTFACPEAVDAVVARHHVIAGQELVVDKAAPKARDGASSMTTMGQHRPSSRASLPPLSVDSMSAAIAAGAFNGLLAATAASYSQQHLAGGGALIPPPSLGAGVDIMGASPPRLQEHTGEDLAFAGVTGCFDDTRVVP